ncbi:Predicted transcriptional regulator, lambda repressor-like DNA-binding domain [Bosea sp. CRIB-10]|uniref:helix-turn-helix domain-containing protein n=1 Tax=Bosea sp. CRIB-10 TaxID=378404 RepID=UPI0008DEABD2|nr:helix-turn-helix domain-containing protein [Bosea sp. CRIB-10]SFD72471.1 Predicted transcriptional regulator, lambda repressor-like DNA-binding domain [Bosea sp. CRIB-10]
MALSIKANVVAALHEAGLSAERVAIVLGCSASEWNTALHCNGRAVPRVQSAVAALTGRSPNELWPNHYDGSGALRPGVEIYRPGKPNSRNPERASIEQTVALLRACGHGSAIRLIPVVVPRSARPRSLPPLISVQKAA